jgi:hypothetical protein
VNGALPAAAVEGLSEVTSGAAPQNRLQFA